MRRLFLILQASNIFCDLTGGADGMFSEHATSVCVKRHVSSQSVLIGHVQASKLSDGLRTDASTVFTGLIAQSGSLTVTNLVDKEEVGHLTLYAHFFASDLSLIMSIVNWTTYNELYHWYPKHPAEWSPAGLVRCQLSKVSFKVLQLAFKH